MALQTTLIPHLADQGQAIVFRDEHGQTILRYAGLYVSDATGRELPAHLSLSPGREGRGEGESLHITIDVTDAVYPLTVDPLLTSQVAKLTASDGAIGDQFGRSVAISGDTIVVGAWQDDDDGDTSGSAYVFARNQ
ncbi:MAG: FG-GAP repeat protein, partial [Anaerolineae bacterium]|nr:FG-GAP repeat protein [Anaerolineae bacterium]